MAQRRNLPRETLSPGLVEGRGYTIGRVLSQIFHPILLNIVSFLVVGLGSLPSRGYGLAWAGYCILGLLLPPAIFYRMRRRQGAYSDEDVSVRQQRNELYLFSLLWIAVATPVLALLGAPRPFLALMICMAVLGLIGGVVNLFWKISVHSASIAMAAMVALLYLQSLGVVLWLCALAVGWARIRTGNHTPAQVLVGFGIAALVVPIVFRIVA